MDDIESLLWVIVIVAIAVRYFVTTNRFGEMRRTLDLHTREIATLKKALAERQATATAPEPAPVPEIKTAPILPPTVPHEEILVAPPAAPQPPPSQPASPAPRQAIKTRMLEQQFGGRAFVWVGGIALALAGFYLVKYSIDTGLLTEQVRVVMGVLFGVALLTGSYFVRARPAMANGVRIGQALAGAGIADLYGSLFAATTLYHLLPTWLGFAALAVTTAAALILSLRHGAPIAMLGLVGGYATPMMVHGGDPNAPVLFGYLYLVFTGLSVVTRGKNWWWLSILTTFVAFAWVVLWLFNDSGDTAWLSTFLLAIAATAVLTDRRTDNADTFRPRGLSRYFAPSGAVVLMGIVAYTSDFGLFEWAMYGLFSLGAIGLAWFNGRTYSAVPWLAMAVNLAMLAGWNTDGTSFAIVLFAFAVLFCASGQILLTRSKQPILWAGLSASAAVLYFLLAYDTLNADLTRAYAGNAWFAANAIWAAIAFALSALMTGAAARPFVVNSDTALRHRLQAIFAVAATGLLSVGLAILLHQAYLSFAIAVQILALTWIRMRIDVPALRYLSYVITAQFALLLLPDIAALFAEAAGVSPPLSQTAWDTASDALFRFGLPAALFAGASYLLRRQNDEHYAIVLELGAVALLATTLYKIIQAIFLGSPPSQTVAIGSIFTIVLAALAIAVLRVNRLLGREHVFWAGTILAGLAVLRIAALDLVVFDPLWSHQNVGALPIANALLAVFVFPALLLYAFGFELERSKVALLATVARGAAYVLGFIWLSFSVRQAFNGVYLDSGTLANAEVYAYSAVWLVVGVALLFGAALREDITMRIASLLVMLLTVGKVFLYDASQLTGLWRVVSFLGLGLSLLALSWFYSRFIFTPETPREAS